ncbi:hypothetical protein [Agathobacter ruminis]|uniref:Uncharacterized protein n=1 Tax=Agathobacter ruminis TaxID=1712665 RepID=A0A2G3E5R6_9FIRM|nr:hypothetical protein [Agathobacter ruminis]MDC7301114.1 hypothetical protein [Agathobacter ruminis]PHU38423.1 hypothetical protein CSX02_02490 [Agathobacter ruminis]
MRFQLAKTLDGIEKYGPVYDLGSGWPDKIEEYVADDVDDWFLNNMVDQINASCETLLDDGDYDYLDAEKCAKLVKLLDNISNEFIPEEYEIPIATLKDYAIRAIHNNTGISIEL